MDNFESTKKRALRILGNRNFSEQEMHKRLVSKGETEENAAETVRWLVELGYINDSDYTTLIVRHYAAKGYGEARIKNELFKRGIPRDYWEEKLAEISDEDQSDAAVEFLTKKLRGSDDKDDLRRAATALVRRGFSYDEARAAVSNYLESQERQQ
jgi:regulatory protein